MRSNSAACSATLAHNAWILLDVIALVAAMGHGLFGHRVCLGG